MSIIILLPDTDTDIGMQFDAQYIQLQQYRVKFTLNTFPGLWGWGRNGTTVPLNKLRALS